LQAGIRGAIKKGIVLAGKPRPVGGSFTRRFEAKKNFEFLLDFLVVDNILYLSPKRGRRREKRF